MSTRRKFLGFLATTAGLSVTAALGVPQVASAAGLTAEEAANAKIVADFCAAWVAPLDYARIGSFLAEGCVYRPTEVAPAIRGRDAIIEGLKGMLGPVQKAQFEVVETTAKGSIVINERFDRFTLPQRSVTWHGVGVFYVKDGKIAEWSDFTILAK